MAQQAVDMKYAPIENQIQTLQTQIGIAKEHMSREDAKRADVISAIADERKQKTADAKELEKGISQLAVQAAANGAPMSLVNQIKNSKTLVDAAHIASQYSPPKNSTTTDPTGIPVEKMTTTQINNDYKSSIQGLSGVVQTKSGQSSAVVQKDVTAPDGHVFKKGEALTREAAAATLFAHYQGRIGYKKILDEIYATYK